MHRVLIADQDESLLDAYHRYLSRDGFEVATATDGLECLAKFRGWKPDVFVLGPKLLWGQGEGILAMMAEGFVPLVPVIVLLGRDDPDALSRRADFPISEYHEKPLAPDLLVQRVRRLLEYPAPTRQFITEWA